MKQAANRNLPDPFKISFAMGRGLIRLRPMLLRSKLLVSALVLSACQPSPPDVEGAEFMAQLSPYCGQAYEGRVVSDDPLDDDWKTETIIANFDVCTPTGVRIPVHVGEDQSREWLLALGDDGLIALRHQHTHEDGTPDAVTMYGGKSAAGSNATRQEFPADDRTKALFDEQEIPESKPNVWAMEIHPDDDMFAYELRRPERFFRLEFDLSDPVEPPTDAQ